MIKIMTIVGARPNFLKAAPIIAAILSHNERGSHGGSKKRNMCAADSIQHVLVHTGQHYDHSMSDSFFEDLKLPAPDVRLEVGSASHAAQTAEIMKRFEAVLAKERPDVVIVVGDVNSTVACALVTAKFALDAHTRKALIAHVEAGLRSFDRDMPEEINRIVTDHLSDLLFVTEESGVRNLKREGIPREKIHFVGNTMIDSLEAFREKAEASTILAKWGLRNNSNGNRSRAKVKPYALLTLHRPSNVDDRLAFQAILDGLDGLAKDLPIIFSAHPRTQNRIEEFELGHYFCKRGLEYGATIPQTELPANGIVQTGPLGYLDFMCLMMHANLVVTDSGGIQEETTCLRVPCVTVRENTERPITVKQGTNVLAGTTSKGIRKVIAHCRTRKVLGRIPPKWDGKAAGRIVETLVRVATARNFSR
jgi:UDP-N-acetylglucosamine 2-epimerase (non-hydrolysing)